VGVPGLDAVEILEFRNLLKDKQRRDEEEKKKANSFASKVVALFEEHKILSVAIQFVITVGVAFVLGYYSLRARWTTLRTRRTSSPRNCILSRAR